MKILISSTGDRLENPVDPRFGRARFFCLADDVSKELSFHENSQNFSVAQGAGIQAAQNAIHLGAEVLITGHCGPKAFRVLASAGVRIFTGASGSITEALENFQKGRLEEAKSADVEGHWV